MVTEIDIVSWIRETQNARFHKSLTLHETQMTRTNIFRYATYTGYRNEVNTNYNKNNISVMGIAETNSQVIDKLRKHSRMRTLLLTMQMNTV